MPRRSAGVLLFRKREGRLEVFLVHPGGPYWAKKDLGAWTIPKGEIGPEEEPLSAAKREFEEETGFIPPEDGVYIPLKPLKQPSGKVIEAWAVEGDCDPAKLTSNLFQMEWPPKSGRTIEAPEADRGAWFTVEEALQKIINGQRGFVKELQANNITPPSSPSPPPTSKFFSMPQTSPPATHPLFLRPEPLSIPLFFSNQPAPS